MHVGHSLLMRDWHFWHLQPELPRNSDLVLRQHNPLPQSENVTVSIDGGPSYNGTYPDPHDSIQWYQTPTLADGTHNIPMRGIGATI
ncbi:hypothetical protein BD779DRAFT_1021636 [Infundibulicybe gibba]|nr:hypothetical protein BD779DRAFT_1021636 [Infundibulicybe gibba]